MLVMQQLDILSMLFSPKRELLSCVARLRPSRARSEGARSTVCSKVRNGSISAAGCLLIKIWQCDWNRSLRKRELADVGVQPWSGAQREVQRSLPVVVFFSSLELAHTCGGM